MIVLCDGNSITAGYPSVIGDSYPSRLQVLLGNKINLWNFGKPGATTEELVNRAPSLIYPWCAYGGVVIFFEGTNQFYKTNQSEMDYWNMLKSYFPSTNIRMRTQMHTPTASLYSQPD